MEIYSDIGYCNILLFRLQDSRRTITVYSKYQENKRREENPDIPAIESIICYFLSRVILANVAFNRYDELYKKYGKTQYNSLLQPSIAINVGNIFGVIGCIYILMGFMERYERNITGPVFGI